MRYRKLTPDGDYSFGRGRADFLANSPEAVAQAVRTRLQLLAGEWFLDQTEGLPAALLLGAGAGAPYDMAIRERILETQGVAEIAAYSSNIDSDRRLSIAVTIDTDYGQAAISQVL